jgi:hypothetical protein
LPTLQDRQPAETGNNLAQKLDPLCNAGITNLPFNRAKEFIGHALAVTKPHQRFVAMLLRDSARTRQRLFALAWQLTDTKPPG